MTIRKANPSDAGCWIDGHWGQYGIARMISLAALHGYVDTAAEPPFATNDVVDTARRHLATAGPSTSEPISDGEWTDLETACDDVEEWMNEHVAPEGFSFGWQDGEFFLESDAWWSEESY